MIRPATEQDIPRIVEMGSRSLREGPYAGMVGDNPEQTAVLAKQFLESSKANVLVADEDGKLTGLIAFIMFPHYFSGELTGGEVIWYIEPEYRHSFTAIGLLRAAESACRKAGCVRMQFTAPNEAVGNAYKSLGYKQVEVSYQKEL